MSDFIVNKLNIKLFNKISASSNKESEVLNIQSVSSICVQTTWNSFSAVNPKISVLASNSLEELFVEIDEIIPTGSSGGEILNIQRAGYGFIKAIYTCVSGSGDITLSINGKI